MLTYDCTFEVSHMMSRSKTHGCHTLGIQYGNSVGSSGYSKGVMRNRQRLQDIHTEATEDINRKIPKCSWNFPGKISKTH